MNDWGNVFQMMLFQNAINVVPQVMNIKTVPTLPAMCFLYNVSLVQQNMRLVALWSAQHLMPYRKKKEKYKNHTKYLTELNLEKDVIKRSEWVNWAKLFRLR